jgi:hypothetical protein
MPQSAGLEIVKWILAAFEDHVLSRYWRRVGGSRRPILELSNFIFNALCYFLRGGESSFPAFHKDISQHDLLDIRILALANPFSDNPSLYLAVRL